MGTVLVCKEGFWEKKCPKFKFKILLKFLFLNPKKRLFSKHFCFLYFWCWFSCLLMLTKYQIFLKIQMMDHRRISRFIPFLNSLIFIWFSRFGWGMGKTSRLFHSSRFWKWTKGKRWSFMVPVSSLLCYGGLLLRRIAWNEVRLHKLRVHNVRNYS